MALFPRGVSEKNFGWLFPTISNGDLIFDKLCVLPLTYRNSGSSRHLPRSEIPSIPMTR